MLDEEDIVVKIEVKITKIIHINRFFCIIFSFFVIRSKGTVIQVIIQIISLKLRVSLKKNKLIKVTKIGQKVLYKGKNITESIFFKDFNLEKIERVKKETFINAKKTINIKFALVILKLLFKRK